MPTAQNTLPKGLDGVIVGETAISGLDTTGERLIYRGHYVDELVATRTFAEVTYLLWYGALPNSAELASFDQSICEAELTPAEVASACSKLDELNSESSTMTRLQALSPHIAEFRSSRAVTKSHNLFDGTASASSNSLHAVSLLARLPYFAVPNAFGRSANRLNHSQNSAPPRGLCEQNRGLLRAALTREPSATEIRLLDQVRILYAEHGFNASTFTARVVASTGAQMPIAVSAALGSFSGPLHGGATRQLMTMLDEVETPENIPNWLKKQKSTGALIMGFGHRIYRGRFDVRFKLMRSLLAQACELRGNHRPLDLVDALVKAVNAEKGLFPNLDLACGPTLRLLGFSDDFLVPITAVSRLSGWCAHIMEQQDDNRLIRPSARYVGRQP